ncbi:hypothetical protein [Roseobacter sinensis]|uniref:GNAT family N-acetyltransferase n=1 Tax=Roseobacter sinensis TaxID=2931391 RepID=A0ABT3BE81_9RHOB|nr:hypothetical protein [Roseobacter sp. WL0113]MCV3271879.1 hypothetical protein [Roseobacter sp. WL0113]
MQPHPDFAGTALPREATFGPFRLSPLSVAQVDEDFKAVTASVRVLTGLFGDDWPKGLTRADNLIDMGWHEREFTALRSFAWIVRDTAGHYLGCAYLYPEIAVRGRGEVVTWMCDTPERLQHLAAFNAAFRDWLTPFLPQGYDLQWTTNDQP